MSRSRHRRGERGTSALEFGIVAPIILMAIFGIIQYGYLYWSLETASAAAREAARQLIVGTDETCSLNEAVSKASMPTVGSAAPTANAVYHDTSGAVAPGPVVGGIVTVTVSFQSLDLRLPFLPMPNGGVVTEDGAGRVENVPAVPLAC